MNQLAQLPRGLYRHTQLPNHDTLREQVIAEAVRRYTEQYGPPLEVFIYRVSNRPSPVDHLCIGPVDDDNHAR